MKTSIGLELIGGDPCGLFYRRQPWVARIDGFDSYYGYKRQFMPYVTDYSRCNSTGSRGVMHYYCLDDGIYEVSERISWKRTRRYFILAFNGEYEKVEREEVDRWLKNYWESAS